jgi:2-haloacid dehalogenase
MSYESIKDSVKVCMFDQYGTVVDMQGGLTAIATPFLRQRAGAAIPIPLSPGGGAPISRTR